MSNKRIIEKFQDLESITKQAAELEAELQKFENQYQMRTSDFYRLFQNGELGDDLDFVEWSSFYQMKLSLEKRLEVLQGGKGDRLHPI